MLTVRHEQSLASFNNITYASIMKFLAFLGCAILAIGCSDAATSLDSLPIAPAGSCRFPLVRLRTGQDTNCSGGNEHLWPIGMAASDCHGWQAVDTSGKQHDNSANDIKCNADGSFSYTQFAGNLDCSGNGETKTFSLNACVQDIPPSLHTIALDLTCCSAPDSPECVTGNPSVTVAGAGIVLNGMVCKE